MNERPTRKRNRLKDYDYSQNGAYFVTICAKDRKKLFCEITAADSISNTAECYPYSRLQLTDIGQIVDNEISKLSSIYENVIVDIYVIMPNHVHMIIRIYGQQDATPTVSRIMNQWKRAISVRRGFSPWQKSFHDHIIRNEASYNKIAEYIENNPITWEEDCFYV